MVIPKVYTTTRSPSRQRACPAPYLRSREAFRSRDDLPLSVFDRLVSRHREASVRNGLILSIQVRREGIFLQPQRQAERRRLPAIQTI
jgi:hypothetical protein